MGVLDADAFHPRNTLFVLVIRVLTAPPPSPDPPPPAPESRCRSRLRSHISPDAPPTASADRRLCFDIHGRKRESITTTTQQHPATHNAMAVTTSLIFASRKKTQQQNVCVQDPTTKNCPTERREKTSPDHQTSTNVPGDAKPASVSHPIHHTKKRATHNAEECPPPFSLSPRLEALVEQPARKKPQLAFAQARILCASHAPYPS